VQIFVIIVTDNKKNSVFLCAFSVFLCVINEKITQRYTEKTQSYTEIWDMSFYLLSLMFHKHK